MNSATPAAVDVRAQLVHALELDLVGPGPGSPLESEVLLQAPSRWYLTGFLVPADADEAQRVDETAAEEVDALDQSGGTDDAGPPEPASARRVFFPSSMGLSVLVPPEASHLAVTVRWGDYRLTNAPTALAGEEGEAPDEQQGHSPRDRVTSRRWAGGSGGRWLLCRCPGRPRPQKVNRFLPAEGSLVLCVRPLALSGAAADLVPAGVRSVSVFLVNRRRPAGDDVRDEAFAFQASLEDGLSGHQRCRRRRPWSGLRCHARSRSLGRIRGKPRRQSEREKTHRVELDPLAQACAIGAVHLKAVDPRNLYSAKRASTETPLARENHAMRS